VKEPEKLGKNVLEQGVTLWTPPQFQRSIEDGKPVKARLVEVKCPYCAAGEATLTVEGPDVIRPGEAQKADVSPKQCDSCKRWFRIGFRMQYIGIRMEG
jgi:glutaredoxin